MAWNAGSMGTAQLFNRLFADHSKTATVATAETTSSTSYVDLATPGPAVTLTSSGTLALCIFEVAAFGTDATLRGQFISVAVSGATTIAASDAKRLTYTSNSTGSGYRAAGFAFLTITPGVNTFTLKYRVSSGTGSFSVRDLWVMAP